MASRRTDLQIRGIPVALRERLRRRADHKGLSMSQYVIEILKDDLARPTVAEWAAEVGKLPPIDLGGKTGDALARETRRGIGLEDCLSYTRLRRVRRPPCLPPPHVAAPRTPN